MLRIGTGAVNITPKHPVELFGYYMYFEPTRVSTGIHTELFASAIVLSGGKKRVALVSCDLCEISREIVEKAKLLIKDQTGIKNVVISMTHTHSGPAVCFGRGLGEIDRSYYSSIPRLIAAAVLQANKKLVPVTTLSRGKTSVPGVSYNRSVPDGYVDDELSAIIFDGVVALWNFACHPVSQKRERIQKEDGQYNVASTMISGDYPAVVAELLEENTKLELSLFFQGADGDLDPKSDFNQKGNTEAMASILATDVFGAWMKAESMPKDLHRLWFKQMKVRLDMVMPTAEDIKRVAAEKKQQKHQGWVKFWTDWEQSMLAKLAVSEQLLPYIEAEVTALAIGDCLMLFHPAELYSSLGRAIKDASPFAQTWVVSNANGTVGYLSTDDPLDTRKNYSAEVAPAACDMFPYENGQGQKLVNALIELAAEAGEAMGIKQD